MGGVAARLSLYAAVLAGVAAFALLFEEGGAAFATMAGAGVVALVVGSAGVYRFLLLPPVAALYTLVAVYGPPPLFSAAGWRSLFSEVRVDLYEAAGIMYLQPVPYEAHPGLFVLLVPLAVAVGVFATSATLYEGSPIFSIAILGITLGTLSTVSFEVGVGAYFAVFLSAAVGLLLFTGSPGRRSRRDEPAGGWQRGLLAGAAVVVLVTTLPQTPLSDAALRQGFVDWTRIGAGDTSRLATEADVGDYLNQGRETELLRVRSPEPLLWRGGTLDRFDGARWSSTTRPGEESGEQVASGVETSAVEQRFEVLSAETEILFGGYNVAAVSLSGAEQASDGSWSMGRTLSEGSSYRVLSEVPQPTDGQLRGAGTSYPEAVGERFLQMPEDRPAVIGETAERIEAEYDTRNPYETARAIERYLVHDGGFTYNLDVSYRRADRAIEEFLGDGREGFCTQFATSMALLLRDMDVPSRVVYGATAGEEVGEEEYVVRGRNMHTWVEVYFPGVGWYPFDPTPGIGVTAAMEENAPREDLGFGEQDIMPGSPEPGQDGSPETTGPSEDEASDGAGGDAVDEGAPAWPLYLIAPALLLSAGPLVKRALLSRGRPEDYHGDLTSRLADVLPPGTAAPARSPALTPSERVLYLSEAAGLGRAPFEEFARAYSDHLYSPNPGARVSTAHRRALREYGRLPLWRRALGALNPASLLHRGGRALSRAVARGGRRLRSGSARLRRTARWVRSPR